MDELRNGYNNARQKVSSNEQTDTEINRITNRFVASKMAQTVVRKRMTFLVPIIDEYLQEFGNMHPVDFGEKLIQLLEAEMSQ